MRTNQWSRPVFALRASPRHGGVKIAVLREGRVSLVFIGGMGVGPLEHPDIMNKTFIFCVKQCLRRAFWGPKTHFYEKSLPIFLKYYNRRLETYNSRGVLESTEGGPGR